MSRLLLSLGEMTFCLAVLIALWDIRNEFLPWLAGAGILMLGAGVVAS